jgi:hypothetical protein
VQEGVEECSQKSVQCGVSKLLDFDVALKVGYLSLSNFLAVMSLKLIFQDSRKADLHDD